ncbi:MAG: glycoside hydrolase family 88 protein [Bacteroidetes bacterium]|nr:glycoside hydrolase family 88 protein [Bacteroidota bacterium]
MKNKTAILLIFICLSISKVIPAQKQDSFKPDPSLIGVINNALDKAVTQYKVLGKNLPAGVLPKTFIGNKKLETSSSTWWTSGFYPGSIFYLYEYSKDTALLHEALNREKLLEVEKNNKGTHDLGFMMFCSFGNANRLFPSKEYESILLTSAKSLSTRFNPTIGCIKSWDHGTWKFPVIIDNMMNLELLFWATKVSGDSSYYKIAVTHANTTMKNHYRKDHSSFHVVDYDPNTGNVIGQKTAQGYADASAWARGQSWGLYGYTLMYRFTKEKKYLTLANQIAHYIIDNPNLPADKIPYWDFNTVDIPATYRDASAGSIAASALIELSSYTDSQNKLLYLKTSEKIIKALASPVYTAKPGENGGFLLKHSVGNWPGFSEIDVPLTYADYYFIEAMTRYKKLVK